jgi:hypothetical protein
MRWIICLLILFLSTKGIAQCATFRLNAQKDTLDCTDVNGKKQGKWVVKVEEIRGEPGYEEEGEFKDDKKEGPWRKYNLIGDFIALENYRWGFKDGESQYFNIYGLEHTEFWHATNPIYPYDTVYVPNVNNPDLYEMKVVKVSASTVKHGTWKYYDPETGRLIKTESYLFDKLQDTQVTGGGNPQGGNNPSAATGGKPKEVTQFEKKIMKKKKVVIRDGAVQY